MGLHIADAGIGEEVFGGRGINGFGDGPNIPHDPLLYVPHAQAVRIQHGTGAHYSYCAEWVLPWQEHYFSASHVQAKNSLQTPKKLSERSTRTGAESKLLSTKRRPIANKVIISRPLILVTMPSGSLSQKLRFH